MNYRHRDSLRDLALLCGLLGAFGCSEYQPNSLEQQPASEKLNRFSADGFIFAAEIPRHDDFYERYLWRDIRRWDILPLLTFFENRNPDYNFEVRLKDASFRLADGTEFETLALNDVIEEVSYSDEMTEDYRKKAIKDRNLPPLTGWNSSKMQGFIFFRPKGKELSECDLSAGHLSIEITKRGLEGGETFSAEIINP